MSKGWRLSLLAAGSLLAVVSSSLAACDGPAAKETTEPEPSASAEAEDAGAEAPSPEPPSQPKPQNTVTFKSKPINMEGFTLSHAEASKHKMSTGAKPYVAMIVHLANYDRGGGSYLPKASKEGQRKITLNFASPGPPAVGTYPVDGVLGESNKLSVGIHSREHHVGLISGTGTGEITNIDGNTISGKVSVQDEHGTSVEATFHVVYEKK